MKELQAIAKQENVSTVFFETLASDKTAKTLAADTGLKTDVLDPLEGITDKSQGADYIEVMRSNLKNLQKALGSEVMAVAATEARAMQSSPRQADDQPVISLRGATASLGSRPVLRGVDLTVHRGEVVALLGANGSGKSTAVRAVVGQVPLTDGSLSLFGTDFKRFRDWSRIGYVPQRTTAASGVPATVREVVSSGRLARSRFGLLRKADRAAVERALVLVGMESDADASVNALSGGQHQRVLIARALAVEPELLIMDEPMAGVDLANQEVLAGAAARAGRRRHHRPARPARAGPAGAPDRPRRRPARRLRRPRRPAAGGRRASTPCPATTTYTPTRRTTPSPCGRDC